MQARKSVRSQGRGLIEISQLVDEVIREWSLSSGLVHVFLRHTSASLLLCENADPDVLADLECWMSAAVEDGDPRFIHRAEGPDDMAAHLRSVLTTNAISLPVCAGRLALGTWQGLFLWEHRYGPHTRELMLTGIAAG